MKNFVDSSSTPMMELVRGQGEAWEDSYEFQELNGMVACVPCKGDESPFVPT